MRSSFANGAATTAAARNSATCVNVTSVMGGSVRAAGGGQFVSGWTMARPPPQRNVDAQEIVKNLGGFAKSAMRLVASNGATSRSVIWRARLLGRSRHAGAGRTRLCWSGWEGCGLLQPRSQAETKGRRAGPASKAVMRQALRADRGSTVLEAAAGPPTACASSCEQRDNVVPNAGGNRT